MQEQRRKFCSESRNSIKTNDCESVGSGIRELKINYAKGYGIYFKETNGRIIILLIGGDKSTQQKDMEKAKAIWNRIK